MKLLDMITASETNGCQEEAREEFEYLQRDAKVGNALCAILGKYVGETGKSEGAVDVLNRKLTELDRLRKLAALVETENGGDGVLMEALQNLADFTCSECDDGVMDDDGHYLCMAHVDGCSEIEPVIKALAEARRVREVSE